GGRWTSGGFELPFLPCPDRPERDFSFRAVAIGFILAIIDALIDDGHTAPLDLRGFFGRDRKRLKGGGSVGHGALHRNSCRPSVAASLVLRPTVPPRFGPFWPRGGLFRMGPAPKSVQSRLMVCAISTTAR